MSKITSKLQVTVPKTVAERFNMKPGDEIEWEAAGDTIRVIPKKQNRRKLDPKDRLRLFDAATKRLREREAAQGPVSPAENRGWTRDELYGNRGGAR